jgi:hypothetical protein
LLGMCAGAGETELLAVLGRSASRVWDIGLGADKVDR